MLSFSKLKDFNECLDQCDLSDIMISGGVWTWNNEVLGDKRSLQAR